MWYGRSDIEASNALTASVFVIEVVCGQSKVCFLMKCTATLKRLLSCSPVPRFGRGSTYAEYDRGVSR